MPSYFLFTGFLSVIPVLLGKREITEEILLDSRIVVVVIFSPYLTSRSYQLNFELGLTTFEPPRRESAETQMRPKPAVTETLRRALT